MVFVADLLVFYPFTRILNVQSLTPGPSHLVLSLLAASLAMLLLFISLKSAASPESISSHHQMHSNSAALDSSWRQQSFIFFSGDVLRAGKPP